MFRANFSHVLLNRISDYLILTQRPEQAGLTPKRSTIDRIDRILRLLGLNERRLEYRQGFLSVYVDFKNAFDSVDKGSLWDLFHRQDSCRDSLTDLGSLFKNGDCY